MIYTPYYFEDPQHADHCVVWALHQNINIYHFFGPHKLVWSNFERFMQCDL